MRAVRRVRAAITRWRGRVRRPALPKMDLPNVALPRVLSSAVARVRQGRSTPSTPDWALLEDETEPVAQIATTSTPQFDSAVPNGLQVAASWAWRVLLLAILIGALGYGLQYLSEVTIPLALASLLAAMLTPVAFRLHLWGLPKSLAALISVFGGLSLIAGALVLIGTQIAGQATDLSKNVVTGFGTIVDYLRNSRIPINDEWFQLDKWNDTITNLLVSSETTITAYVAQVSAQVGHFLAGFAITLFALFYFLYEGRRIWLFLLNFFPRAARRRVDAAARQGWTSLSHYVRATILVALSDAVGVLIVALVLGVPLAPALAALVFIGAFVPLVGAFVSGFVAVIVALVALGWVTALIMLAGIMVVMWIEGHILQPFLLGRAVKLHPLAVLLGIAIGIIVGGIVGALMSIPILAFSKSFIQDLSRMHDDVLPTGEVKI